MDKVDPQLLMRDTRVLVELVKEFADEAHLPFDAAGCLAQMRDTVADIRTHCGDDFNFAPVERALEELDKACAFVEEVTPDKAATDLFFLRMQHATNQLDNPLKIAETKRDIARVKTVIREKEEK